VKKKWYYFMKLTAIDWCYPVIKRRMILYNGYKVSSN